MKKRAPRSSLPADERQARSRLRQLLGQADGLLHGTIIEMTRRCGNPRCRCSTDDNSKHRSFYLGQTLAGKTSMQYIPKDLEQTVRSWVEDFQEASTLLESISQHGHLRFKSVKESRAEKKSTTARKTSAKKAIRKKRATQKKRPGKKTTSTRRKRSS
jgi:hypothetical protein